MAKVSGREDTGLSAGPNGRIDYDEVLKHVGQMGKFQTRVFLLLCLVSALSGLAVFAFGFTGSFLILEPQNIMVKSDQQNPSIERLYLHVFRNKTLKSGLSTHLQVWGYKFS